VDAVDSSSAVGGPGRLSFRRVGQLQTVGIHHGPMLAGPQFQVLEPGNGRLEASVVVQRNLVVDVLLPQVLIVVVIVGSADQRPVQHLRIGFGAPVRFPVARSWAVLTGAVNRRQYGHVI